MFNFFSFFFFQLIIYSFRFFGRMEVMLKFYVIIYERDKNYIKIREIVMKLLLNLFLTFFYNAE